MPPLMPVAEARERILEGFTLGPVENVPLARGLGRSLARPVSAKRSQPPADVSAMDGYAVRSADLGVLPKALRVIDEIAAGQSASIVLGQYEAVRIFTGALMPAGADMVA
ncbi:MAG TPA: molybdopterin molybdenumtransferase MoeA, partial [Alphaproteobacteria bacterium]|nr:molybdopterin molybdenumtransferase MoeA [Alphaproteobacteria bacterium]